MDEWSATSEVIQVGTERICVGKSAWLRLTFDLPVIRPQIRFPSTHGGLVSRMRLQPESFTQPPGSSPGRGSANRGPSSAEVLGYASQ